MSLNSLPPPSLVATPPASPCPDGCPCYDCSVADDGPALVEDNSSFGGIALPSVEELDALRAPFDGPYSDLDMW